MTAPTTLPDERVDAAPWTAGATSTGAGRGPGLLGRLGRWADANRVFAAALAVAFVLRVVVAVAYPPALEFTGDSPSYLAASHSPFTLGVWHPFGYPVFLWVLSAMHSLLLVTLLQHLMGLAAAVLLYRLVRGLEVGAVGATVAASPLLFDAYQLDVEQFVLSDTLFTLLTVAAVTLAMRILRGAGLSSAVGLGGLLAAAALVRTVGLGVAGAVVVVLLLARAGWSRVAVVAASCALPLGIYALAFHAAYGVYGLQGYGGRYLYGLVAPFASCDRAALPVDERGLCPTLPKYARPGVNQYVWSEYNLAHVPGDSIQRSKLAGDFARPIAMHQLGDAAAVTAGNVLHYFAPGRQTGPRDWFGGSWQFPLKDRSPAWNIYPAKYGFGDGVTQGRIVNGLAETLRGYQRVVFVPGPALALALVVAAAACCLRRLPRLTRASIALTSLAGLSLLVLPSVSAGFDWRYLLPAQALVLPAGVLASRVLRAPLRRALGRALPAVTVAVAAAVVAPGLAAAGVLPSSSLRPHTEARTPATLAIGRHALVRVDAPTLLGTRCRRTTTGWRLEGLVAFPTTVTFRSGRPLLVQAGNLGLSNGEVSTPWIAPKGPQLPNAVLSDRYPRAHGMVYAEVTSAAGTIRYVDPLGAGAAAWTYRLTDIPRRPELGDACTGSYPWAGQQLRYLRVSTLPAFTEQTTQPIDYGLHWEDWRAASYDLRFRVASPTTAPGPWQYPHSWQRATVTEQSLVNLSAGITYCFSVRARDDLGAVTDWSPPKCTARMYDDAALPPSPGWTRVSGQPGFYLGSYTATRTKDAALSVSGTFSRVSVSAYRCPECGVLDVYVGTRLVRRLNLASSAAGAGLWQWTSSPMTDRTSTVTFKVHSNDRVVAIDGFGLLR